RARRDRGRTTSAPPSRNSTFRKGRPAGALLFFPSPPSPASGRGNHVSSTSRSVHVASLNEEGKGPHGIRGGRSLDPAGTDAGGGRQLPALAVAHGSRLASGRDRHPAAQDHQLWDGDRVVHSHARNDWRLQ